MLSNFRASAAAAAARASFALRSFIASSSHSHTCRPRLTSHPPRTSWTRTLKSKVEDLEELINITASESFYTANKDKDKKSKSSTVYIKNLPQHVNERYLRDHLDGFPGIDSAKFFIVRNSTGISVGFGFIEFDIPTQADEFIRSMSGNWAIDGEHISVQLSYENRIFRRHDPGYPSKSIQLGPLPSEVELETLTGIFEDFEGVKRVHLGIKKNTLDGKFAYVTFRFVKDAKDAMKRLQHSGLTIDYRPIKASYAHNAPPKSDTSQSRFLRLVGLEQDKRKLYELFKSRGCNIKAMTRICFKKESTFIELSSELDAVKVKQALDGRIHNGRVTFARHIGESQSLLSASDWTDPDENDSRKDTPIPKRPDSIASRLRPSRSIG